MADITPHISYEGSLGLPDGYRVIVVRVAGRDRCFPIGPNGHPLARTGYPSIDEARQLIETFRAAARAPDTGRLPPSALPPERQQDLEPLMDTVMRVEIRGIYVALLGILLGGDPVMWVLELPARHDSRSSKIFRDETAAVEAYESLCAELSMKYIETRLDDSDGDS